MMDRRQETIDRLQDVFTRVCTNKSTDDDLEYLLATLVLFITLMDTVPEEQIASVQDAYMDNLRMMANELLERTPTMGEA
jgi:hypothetical protein